MYLPVHAAWTSPCVMAWQHIVKLRSAVHPYGQKKKQAFRGVAAFSGAQKRDVPSCVHSPGKSTFSDVAALSDIQGSRSSSHEIVNRAQKPASSKYVDGTARSGSATETPPDEKIRYT